MTPEIHALWVYLSTTPLLWLTLTLIAYQLGEGLFERFHSNPACNPVMVAVIALVVVLKITGTDYKTYFSGAQFVHFLLGPATVALAIPLYHQIHTIRRSFPALAVALLTGSLAAAGSAVGIAWLLGATPAVVLSLAPKSVTTPIAMGIAEHIGGLPSLTSAMVALTGIVGGAFGVWVLNRLKITDSRARGLALGLGAHGMGTARAVREDALAGAFAGLAMGINGLLTALLLPVLVALFR